MGNVECCIERDNTHSGALRTRNIKLHPADSKPVDGSYTPLILYWHPYLELVHELDEKIKLWPITCPLGDNNAQRWDARSKVLFEFFHLADEDDDLFIEWENGEIRNVCRRMFVFDKLPAPQMSEQTWVALYREYERDDRNLLGFREVCLFVRYVYQAVFDLASSSTKPVEVAPNVFLPQRNARSFDKTPNEDELKFARELREEDCRRNLEIIQKQHKEEQEAALAHRAKIEKEREQVAQEREFAEKKRKEYEEKVKKRQQEEKQRQEEMEAKRYCEIQQRQKTSELAKRKVKVEDYYQAQLEVKRLAEASRIAQQHVKEVRRKTEEMKRLSLEARKTERRKRDEEECKRREEMNVVKQVDNDDRQRVAEAYKLKALAEEGPQIEPTVLLETSDKWHKDFQPVIEEMAEKVDSWDEDHIIEALSKLFTLVDRDNDGVLHWNNSEIRTFIKSVFGEQNLPAPELTETQWRLMFQKFDRNNTYAMNIDECVVFAKHFHLEAIATESEHSHDLPRRYKKYFEQIEARLELWDEDSNQEELIKLFRDVDIEKSGWLQWNNSEIRNFTRLIFAIHGFPMPKMCESTWYQLYREIDKEGNYTMALPEASSFVKHVYSRILDFYPTVKT